MAGMTSAWGGSSTSPALRALRPASTAAIQPFDQDAALRQRQLAGDQERRRLDAEAEQQRVQQMQEEAMRNQLASQRTAADVQNQMLSSDRSQYSQVNDGLTHTMSTMGDGGGGSTSRRVSAGGTVSSPGLQIGDGLYKNITGLIDQMRQQPITPPPRVAPPVVPSTPNALGPAKEATGRIGNKALEALRNQMTARGMSDSGMAVEGEANILGNVARGQSQAMYDAANLDNSRQWEANKIGYQGDTDYNQMLYSGQLGQRNNDLQILLNLLRYSNG